MLDLRQLNDKYIMINVDNIESIDVCTNEYGYDHYAVTMNMILNEEDLKKIIKNKYVSKQIWK